MADAVGGVVGDADEELDEDQILAQAKMLSMVNEGGAGG
jgi:hypothetical protein